MLNPHICFYCTNSYKEFCINECAPAGNYCALDPRPLQNWEGYPVFPLAAFLKIPADADPIQRMEWLGLLDDRAVPGNAETTILDVLADLLLEKLPYEENERDMFVLMKMVKQNLERKKS